MPCYLIDNPPRRSQFRKDKDGQPERRQDPSGVTVLHTAENMLDLIGVDSGAEDVARFIKDRITPGSYHDLVDSDSALQLVPYEAEAYQDGTGSNPHALSISWAIRAADWPRLKPDRVHALLEQGAVAFARQQAWLRANDYPTTPLVRLSRADSAAGRPGFVTHGDRDPGRRSDPGAAFPWRLWLEACERALAGPTTPTPDERITTMGIVLVQQLDSNKVWACDLGDRKRWWVTSPVLRDGILAGGAVLLNGEDAGKRAQRAALLEVCAELSA